MILARQRRRKYGAANESDGRSDKRKVRPLRRLFLPVIRHPGRGRPGRSHFYLQRVHLRRVGGSTGNNLALDASVVL